MTRCLKEQHPWSVVGEKLAYKSFKRLAYDAPGVSVVGVTHFDGLVNKVESSDSLHSHIRLGHMSIEHIDEDFWIPSFKLASGASKYKNPLLLLPKDEMYKAFCKD